MSVCLGRLQYNNPPVAAWAPMAACPNTPASKSSRKVMSYTIVNHHPLLVIVGGANRRPLADAGCPLRGYLRQKDTLERRIEYVIVGTRSHECSGIEVVCGAVASVHYVFLAYRDRPFHAAARRMQGMYLELAGIHARLTRVACGSCIAYSCYDFVMRSLGVADLGVRSGNDQQRFVNRTVVRNAARRNLMAGPVRKRSTC